VASGQRSVLALTMLIGCGDGLTTEEAPDAGPCQTWGVVGTIGPQLGATPAACANCENGC
jgi:hypothetical protein